MNQRLTIWLFTFCIWLDSAGTTGLSKHIWLLVCGRFCDATPDMCVVDAQTKVNLLVHIGKPSCASER